MAEQTKKTHHVIVLGAGASANSGYPLANQLRLLMSSEQALQKELSTVGNTNKDHIDKVIRSLSGGPGMRAALALFRHGGFATVDEFSKLAYRKLPSEVQDLKHFLRFALSLRNPEDTFHDSDYYSFIQRLFEPNLFPLRKDIGILTFNYDPYLPYLLWKAYHTRCQAGGFTPDINAEDAITSGMTHRLVGALEGGEYLCVLQLHGSIAWPARTDGEDSVAYKDLFDTLTDQRVLRLSGANGPLNKPPIVFPWEIITESGTFVEEAQFCLRHLDDSKLPKGNYQGSIQLYQVFKSIWERARKEINQATKISFVGLSMHDYLKPALRFLFSQRQQDVNLVCVSKEHENFRDPKEVHEHPRSPTFKLRRLAGECCPAILAGRRTEGGWLDLAGRRPQVAVHDEFRQFIENEMD